MTARKISCTKNYRLFDRHSNENRPVDLARHKKLYDSMRLHGFLSCFPIVITRNRSGNMIVKDGQHRLAIAEQLGLPIFYIESDQDFDIAVVNSTAKVWVLRDYARKFSANGKSDYEEGLRFADSHRLPIGTAFALLSGTTSFTNVQDEFVSGKWKVRDQAWADSVAGIYVPLVEISSLLKSQRFIEACMAVCRVSEFNGERLIRNAQRCREKLINYSTRDGFLSMAEEVYNFGHKHMVGLKSLAVMAMRQRSPVLDAIDKKALKKAG